MTNTGQRILSVRVRRNLHWIVWGVVCVAIAFNTYRCTGELVASVSMLAISAMLYVMLRLWSLRKLRAIEVIAWVLTSTIGALIGFFWNESLNGILLGFAVTLWLIAYYWHWPSG